MSQGYEYRVGWRKQRLLALKSAAQVKAQTRYVREAQLVLLVNAGTYQHVTPRYDWRDHDEGDFNE